MTTAFASDREAFYERMAACGLTPLWAIMSEAVPRQPKPTCKAALWSFSRDIRPALLEAGELISAAEAQRRVLILNNPALTRGVTPTLFCGVQMIKGGEIAPAHRHTQSALRFVIEGEGAYTAVDGERTLMHPGDFIVTPAWCWHDHAKPDGGPMFWLDGLDIPLVNYFGATFAEDYGAAQYPVAQLVEDPQLRFAPGLRSLAPVVTRGRSPIINYRYDCTRESLHAMSSGECDPVNGFKLRYAHPTTGDFALPTIASFIQLLPAGFAGAAYRSTEATVYMVVEGSGRVSIGEQSFSLRRNDIFVVPNWTWVAPEANEELVLFSFSDRPVLQKLGLFREETDRNTGTSP